MKFVNARIYRSGSGFIKGSFETEGDRFGRISFGSDKGVDSNFAGNIDLSGKCVIPGLIDIHIHGCAGSDVSDGSKDGIKSMSGFLASRGITSFVPTTMSLPLDSLHNISDTVNACVSEPDPKGARILGIHMEGPFISPNKKGSQNGKYLCKPDIESFRELYDYGRGLIKIIDVAPEMPGAEEFIREASKMCRVSIAHTEADYTEAIHGFLAGASHVTHLYNAMPPMLHRNPGVIGAAADHSFVTAELICDGIHVHPSAVRAAYKLFSGRICLVSDALRCMGMPDGLYELSGQNIYKKEGAAFLEDETLAGSAADLLYCLKKAIEFGIDINDAIDSATVVPARFLGEDDILGSVDTGKYADFIVCDDDLTPEMVYIGAMPV
ncbi:MAG: N-acetylglucosamine-6-phosphate deacetylase [Lachnospiraceae bacterium]|nr:N-acetylglucosamine-6-phosphate deacetylase [Lachnospiraceae bacterium]